MKKVALIWGLILCLCLVSGPKASAHFESLPLTLQDWGGISQDYNADQQVNSVDYATDVAQESLNSQVSFPIDHAQHLGMGGEWWYLNLLVRATDQSGLQKDLAYVVSFSRINGQGRLLTSRYENSTQAFAEHTYSGGNTTGTLASGRLSVSYSSPGSTQFLLTENAPTRPGFLTFRLQGSTAEVGNLDLQLSERQIGSLPGGNDPLLWGGMNGACRGKISVFGPDDTYYYSIPNLDVTGSIIDANGQQLTIVAGKAWLDHQWFNNLPPSSWVGHYWSSFHLVPSAGNPEAIITNPTLPHQALGFVRQVYTTGPQYSYWVRRTATGLNQCGSNGGVYINNYYTDTGYPSTWTFTFQDNNFPLPRTYASITGHPFSANQIFTPPLGPKFFEPAASFIGQIDGINVSGLGFLETHLKAN